MVLKLLYIYLFVNIPRCVITDFTRIRIRTVYPSTHSFRLSFNSSLLHSSPYILKRLFVTSIISTWTVLLFYPAGIFFILIISTLSLSWFASRSSVVKRDIINFIYNTGFLIKIFFCIRISNCYVLIALL